MSNEGELVFELVEKVDKRGEKYLFGGVRLLGLVIFAWPELTAQGEPKRYKAVVKRYQGPQEPDEWEDITPRRKQR